MKILFGGQTTAGFLYNLFLGNQTSKGANTVFLIPRQPGRVKMRLLPAPQVTLHSAQEPNFQKKLDAVRLLLSEVLRLIVYS